MARLIYRPTFLGIKTFVKGPLLKSKKAALNWVLRNAHRVEDDIEVYEVDLDKIKNKEKIVATRWTYMGAVHSAQSNNPLNFLTLPLLLKIFRAHSGPIWALMGGPHGSPDNHENI